MKVRQRLELQMQATKDSRYTFRWCPDCRRKREAVFKGMAEVCPECGYVFVKVKVRVKVEAEPAPAA